MLVDMGSHVDPLGRVQPIAVLHGVRERLAEGDAHDEACRSWRDTACEAMAGDQVDGLLDDVEIRRDTHRDLDSETGGFGRRNLATPYDQTKGRSHGVRTLRWPPQSSSRW